LSVLCALPSAQAVAITRGSCCLSTPGTRQRSRASRAADTWPSATLASRRQPPALVRHAHKPKLPRAAGQRRPLRRLGSRQRALASSAIGTTSCAAAPPPIGDQRWSSPVPANATGSPCRVASRNRARCSVGAEPVPAPLWAVVGASQGWHRPCESRQQVTAGSVASRQ
jgi:hypothetical protein